MEIPCDSWVCICKERPFEITSKRLLRHQRNECSSSSRGHCHSGPVRKEKSHQLITNFAETAGNHIVLVKTMPQSKFYFKYALGKKKKKKPKAKSCQDQRRNLVFGSRYIRRVWKTSCFFFFFFFFFPLSIVKRYKKDVLSGIHLCMIRISKVSIHNT